GSRTSCPACAGRSRFRSAAPRRTPGGRRVICASVFQDAWESTGGFARTGRALGSPWGDLGGDRRGDLGRSPGAMREPGRGDRRDALDYWVGKGRAFEGPRSKAVTKGQTTVK